MFEVKITPTQHLLAYYLDGLSLLEDSCVLQLSFPTKTTGVLVSSSLCSLVYTGIYIWSGEFHPFILEGTLPLKQTPIVRQDT